MTPALFLPGVIAPASLRYAAVLEHLRGEDVRLLDLALYADDEPPPDYSIATEVAAIAAAADRAGWPRFHLYGHSGGAACALAFAAAHPERLRSLAVDEPATDFTDDDRADPYWNEIAAARALPDPDAMHAFLRLQLAAETPLPTPPDGAPPPWMKQRVAGVRALPAALAHHRIDPARYRAFRAPVLFTHGSASHPRWLVMRDRLATLFPDFRAVRFDGVHHLHTSHQAEPERTASLLRDLWAQAR